MTFRDGGEDAREERVDESREESDDATTFSDFHQAEPKREDSGESQADFKGFGRGGESGVHDAAPYFNISHDGRCKNSHNKGHDEEAEPDVVKYHVANV